MCAPKAFIGITLALSLIISILSFVDLGAYPWAQTEIGPITSDVGLFIVHTEGGGLDDDKNIDDFVDWDKADDDTVSSTPSVYNFGRAVTILGGFSSFAGFIYCCVALSSGKRTAGAEKGFGITYLVCGILMLIGGIVWGAHFEKLYSDVSSLDDDQYTACAAFCGLDVAVGLGQIVLGGCWLYMSGLCGEDKFQDLDSV